MLERMEKDGMPQNNFARLGETPLAVIDLETTGIYCGGNDRIIEVAIVRTDPFGRTIDEFETLVNPQRDVGPTTIHGIMAEDVVGAPIFKQVAGDIAKRLVGAIIVAHNLQFDFRFLAEELSRHGIAIPEMPAICTLHLAFRLCPNLPSRKLGWCCEEAGIRHEDEHRALGDARATAALIGVYIQRAINKGWKELPDLGCERCTMPLSSWADAISPSGLTFPRSAAASRIKQERTYLARLVQGLPADDAPDSRTAEYMALLDRALEDRDISIHEAEALVAAAANWGMTRQNVLTAHRLYLSSLASRALEDGVVTAPERRDLESVCDMLGLHHSALDELLVSKPLSQETNSPAENLSGKTVCFTGELVSRIAGQPITRELAEELASKAGLIVKSGVTKKLDLLVCADSHTQSGKAKKAREYGIRIISEPAFWRAIGVNVQ